jgi:2',3'-cyclic-nucleotide 2'-phosphodiesterase (5'-nucleotidase family)
MSNGKRYTALIITAIFTLSAVFANLPGSATGQTQQKPRRSDEDRKALAKRPAPSGTLKDRLDKDDGYGIVFFISSSVHGNLEVCGCPIHPLGGVARRTGYIEAFRRRSPDVPIIQIDTGFIFSDDLNSTTKGLRDDARLMNDWIVRANEAMSLDFVNLSYHDLLYAASLLSPEAKLKTEKSQLISANIKTADTSRLNPAPYVIKTVTGKRLQQPVRIAFIGLSDFAPEDRKESVRDSGFVIEDPLESAKAALAEVRDKADLTVITGFLSLPTVNKLARQNDDLDLILVTDDRGLTLDPKQVNNTLIVYASRETKHLGEVRLYTAEGVVDKFTVRYVELDEIIPDDLKLAEMTKKAREEIDVLQKRVAEEEARAYLAKNPSGPENSQYVLSAKCGECHLAEYEAWKKTRHSHAFEALETKQRTFDAACVGCHSLGYQKQGFVNIKATPQFANVQCESCHGPGAQHSALPTEGNYKTPSKSESCLICHDRENSPDFDFQKYWPVVQHINSLKPEKPGVGKQDPVKSRIKQN